jgi:hypothetical protein
MDKVVRLFNTFFWRKTAGLSCHDERQSAARVSSSHNKAVSLPKMVKKTDFLTKHACSLIEQAAREALTEKVFVKGPDYKNKFGVVFGDGLVTSTGEKHKGKLAPRQHNHCSQREIRNGVITSCGK